MSPKIVHCLFSAALLIPIMGLKADPELDIVKKARAYLGSEAALDSVSSIHYTGTYTEEDGKTALLEIILQKPCQQRITATMADKIEITALDDYDGWQKLQDAKDPSVWKLMIQSPDTIKRLRANTKENLTFYRDPEGKVEVSDMGLAQIDGHQTRKVAFKHAETITFYRYFDSKTGRLMRTETEQGGVIVEQGEMIAGGLRFPKKLINTTKGPDGKMKTITVDFDKVTVNESFASSLFTMPSIGR
ncbi:MAG: hypothetical protein WC378_19220 [Opitutaceae bacterium]